LIQDFGSDIEHILVAGVTVHDDEPFLDWLESTFMGSYNFNWERILWTGLMSQCTTIKCFWTSWSTISLGIRTWFSSRKGPGGLDSCHS
jgi:hypothetical protein